jgi:hypothetical protein
MLSSFSAISPSWISIAKRCCYISSFCCRETECSEAIIFSWSCKFISNSMFCSSRMWFLMIISKKSRFYLVLMRLFISYLILRVVYRDYCSWRPVICFFNKFFLELSFKVNTYLAIDLIYYCKRMCYSPYSGHSQALNWFISLCFFLI